MAWETDSTYELQCEGCGRIGKQIEQSDDWNGHQTLFENFETKWIDRREPGVPSLGGYRIPVCPTCGDKAKIVSRRLPG